MERDGMMLLLQRVSEVEGTKKKKRMTRIALWMYNGMYMAIVHQRTHTLLVVPLKTSRYRNGEIRWNRPVSVQAHR